MLDSKLIKTITILIYVQEITNSSAIGSFVIAIIHFTSTGKKDDKILLKKKKKKNLFINEVEKEEQQNQLQLNEENKQWHSA